MSIKAARRTLVLTMALLMVFLCGCGCSKKEEQPPTIPQGSYNDEGAYVPSVPDVTQALKDAVKKNSDVVAWLQLPNTTINEAVVQTTNNTFYLRRDVTKKYAYEGCYYMDYESVMFDDGKDLARNTIIYGHNLGNPMGVKDDPNGVKFAQLLKLNDIALAEQTPYVYLTTESGNQIFEIFAVFYCEALTSPVPYHYADYPDEQFAQLITDAKKRSLYEYDTTISADDKILTLSTCTYRYGTYSQNPNQRFVVMARLMRSGDMFYEKARLRVNEDPKAPIF